MIRGAINSIRGVQNETCQRGSDIVRGVHDESLLGGP